MHIVSSALSYRRRRSNDTQHSTYLSWYPNITTISNRGRAILARRGDTHPPTTTTRYPHTHRNVPVRQELQLGMGGDGERDGVLNYIKSTIISFTPHLDHNLKRNWITIININMVWDLLFGYVMATCGGVG